MRFADSFLPCRFANERAPDDTIGGGYLLRGTPLAQRGQTEENFLRYRIVAKPLQKGGT
jgi:hypothetical protein